MKKYLLVTVCALVFVPTVVFGVAQNQVETQSQTRTATQNVGEEIKLKIQEMKEARTELKEKIKEEILERSKEKAEKSIDRAIAKYERTKTRINNMPNIAEESKTTIAGEIDKVIQDLTAQKASIATATTAQEVKTIMAEIKMQMRNGYNAVKAAVSAIHATRLTGVAEKLESILEKLTAKVTELGASGTETSQMEALEAKAKEEVDAARAAILAEDFKGAKDSILAARKSLIELSQKIKANTNDQTEEE